MLRFHLFLDIHMGIVGVMFFVANRIRIFEILQGLSYDAFEAFIAI